MRKHYWIYLFLITLTTINYIDRIALSIASSQISQEFGLDPVKMGYLFSSFLWLYAAALIPVGMIVDRFGTRIVNAWGIGLWSVATALTAVTGGFVSLLMTRIIMGLGESTTYPAGGRVVREWSPARERGIATSIFHAGSLLGPAIGAIGLGWVVNAYGWRVAFALAAAIGFVWLAAWLIWFRQPEQVGWLSQAEREQLLRDRDANAAQVASASRIRLGLRVLMRSPTLWAIAVAHGCAVYATYLFLTWLPSYLQAEKGLTIIKSGIYTAIPYIGAAILGILIGRCSDFFLAGADLGQGKRRLVVVGCMLLSALVMLVPYVNNLWGIMALLTLSLTGCTAAVASNISLVNDLLPSKEDSGSAIAFISTGGNIFGIAAPIVTGYVISISHSYHAGFVIAGILLVAGALITLLFVKQLHKPEQGDQHVLRAA